MSWNILPKSVLQYFLEKLKTKFLLSKSNDILGSKNILPFPYTYGSGTVQGLTVTVHEDGSITAQGTPTQDIAFPLNTNLIEDLNLSVGDELIFSEWEVQNQNAFAALLSNGTPISEVRGDYKLTITSELVQNGVAFILFFVRGVDLTTPVTFKPMIRLTTDTDHTWHSPALTNKTLTDRVIYLNHRIEEVNNKTAADIPYSTGVSIRNKIVNMLMIDTLLTEFEVPTTATSYDCNWHKYYFISIEALQYNNVRGQMLVPVSYFANTSAGSRPMVNDFGSGISFQVYQNGNGKVYIVSSSLNSTIGIRIYGIMEK